MQQVQALLLLAILSLSHSATLKITQNSTPKSGATTSKDNRTTELHHRTKGKFAKFSQPPSSGSAGSSLSVQAQCAPQPYRVRLRNGNCSRPVITQMCYGTCSSFTVPRGSGFVRAEDARRGVDRKCNCCSPVKMTTKRYQVPCSIGSKTTKTFFLPFAEKCACRACQR